MVKTDNFILRYANCWEDADLLMSQIDCKPGDSILSICSGGENSLSLLCLNPKEVQVVDINPIQLYLLEIKMAAIYRLNYLDCLGFLGYCDCNQRIEIYNNIKVELSKSAKLFWDKNPNLINQGIIYSGRIEKNLRLFAFYYRPIIHSLNKVNELLEKKGKVEQEVFYEKIWNTTTWRFLFRLFFNNISLKFIAPDPDFFNFVNKNMYKYLMDKTQNHLSNTGCQDNYFLHFALKGNFGNHYPYFMRHENFELIKSQVSKVKLHCGFVQDALKNGRKFDGFNLSNIFEYTTIDEFNNLSNQLVEGANWGAKFVYWNILLPRKISESHPELVSNVLDTSIHGSIIDKGWIYYRCLVDQKLVL